jgi:hypothetical protein
MGFANMQDYMGATDNGDPFLDFSKLTRAKAGALAEVAVEEFVDGRLRECARGQARQVQAARQARCAGGPGPSSRHVSGREPGRRREFSCNFEFWQAPGRALNPAIDLGRAARDRVGAIGSGCGLFLLGGPASFRPISSGGSAGAGLVERYRRKYGSCLSASFSFRDTQ